MSAQASPDLAGFSVMTGVPSFTGSGSSEEEDAEEDEEAEEDDDVEAEEAELDVSVLDEVDSDDATGWDEEGPQLDRASIAPTATIR